MASINLDRDEIDRSRISYSTFTIDRLHGIALKIATVLHSRIKSDVFLSDRQYMMKVSENMKDILRAFAEKLAANNLFSFRAIFDDGGKDVTYYSQNYTVIVLARHWQRYQS